MKKHYAVWLLASGLLLWTNLDISDAAAPGRDTAAPTDPRLDMIVVPRAMDPHPSPDNQANAVGTDTRVLPGARDPATRQAGKPAATFEASHIGD